MNFEISVYGGFQILDDMKPIRCADVRVKADGKKRAKTWIKLMGDSDADLFQSMALWAEKGCPSAADLKAEQEVSRDG